MSIKCKSGWGLKGKLIVLEKVGDGPTVKVIDDDNIVLNVGKNEAIRWLAEGSSYKISKLAVGNGNNPPVTPDENDAGLIHQLSIADTTNSGVDIVNRWTTFRASFNSGAPDFAADPGASNDPADPNYAPYDPLFYPEVSEAGLVLSNGVESEDIFFSKKNFLPRPFEASTNTTLTFIWLVGVI